MRTQDYEPGPRKRTGNGKDKPPKFPLVPFEEIKFSSPLEWLVKKLLPRRGVAAIYGASGSAKTFVLLDLCFHIALGWPWRGRRVAQTPVVYVAAEGAGGVPKRKEGWERNQKILPERVPFYLVSVAPNLGSSPGDL
jgi:putative DNA primase/helicase